MICLVIVFAGIELYLLFDLVKAKTHYGDIPIFELLQKSELVLKLAIFIVIAIGPFHFAFHFFKKIITYEFFPEKIKIEELLKEYFHRRFSTMKSTVKLNGSASVYDLQQNLSRQTLIFLEKFLKEQIGRHHYELSIFNDKDHPQIVCYFDSNNNEVPRSKRERDLDPDYYKKKGYEVIELLISPVTKPVIISSTAHHTKKYSFIDQHQQTYIKSTILYCFDIESPCALVITCDKPDVFHSSDEKISTLLAAAGLAIRGEYQIANLVQSYEP